ncbi:hypothetical protein [Mesorhizobium sp. M7A.F.Ca.CA.001.09.1.1]|uniref:beta strand repeat-containing protein n=1 Tax=Mesorhizobium sp. M7A.F.Ca.CA.001.09.1.1 TaxID=2496718 RepID=UPI000FCCE0C9|nr:hypothetical protein [Mesorhizobium sp. M7A.F.Ca.CA.001.09.1.1]RUZ20086.1 hypothetical protein EN961_16960 [Mesorhizobium sp. M7A.F.Ca.CA.001.09.1.1]
MPRRTDIKSILIIGAGPIVIGQACEFDYSGTQACKALKEEGFRVILVNSNPATIMTDPELADATYIEPITPEVVAKIIAKERPDALLPTMGGQTALNTALSLRRMGVLERYNVEMIGADATAIDKAEDRALFREAMKKIGLETPKSMLANATDVKNTDRKTHEAERAALKAEKPADLDAALDALETRWNLGEGDRKQRYISHGMAIAAQALDHVGLPAIIRPSFTMGGTGGGIAFNNVRFDSNGTGGTVSAGTLDVGTTAAGGRVQGDGLGFNNTSGTLDLGTFSVANNGGTGVMVSAKTTNFTLNSSGGSVDTTGGNAFDLDPLTVNMTLGSVTATGGANGIIFDGVAGTFSVTGATTITGTTNYGISAINTNTGTFNFNTVTVNNAGSSGGGIQVASGTLKVTGLANIDTTSGTGVSQGTGSTSFTGGLTIDTTSGDGFLGIAAGSITVIGTGNTITTATGRIVSLQTAVIGAGGMTFDTLKATGTVGIGAGVQLATVSGGNFNGGALSVAGTSNNALVVQNSTSSAVNFNSVVVSSASANGIYVVNGVTGPVTIGTVTIDNTGGAGVRVDSSSGTININGGSIGATDDPTGSAVQLVGGAATLNIAASLTKTTTGKIVDISGVTGGSVTLSGNLSATGGGFDNGIDVRNNGGGTFTFSGAKTLSTGGFAAVNLANNAGAAIDFTGGGLVINTTSGPGIAASGGATVTVTGASNAITTSVGSALDLSGVTVGAGGINLSSVSVNGASVGIGLNNVASSGGGAIALGTVDLQGITTFGVDVGGTLGAALSFANLDIGLNSTTGVAFDLNGSTINAAVTANDFDVTNASAAGASIGVDLRGAIGGQVVRLGDAAAGGAISSIAGVNTGVFLGSTTNLAFTYGDGESVTDKNSTLGANVGIDAASAPVAGTYNFQDVNLTTSPGLGFGVGKIYFVGASPSGDGTGRDQSNLATLSTAEAASVASDILVLVNNGGVISAAGTNADNTLVLGAGEQVRGFGNGAINLALAVPSTIQLSSNSISIIDQTPDGAATLTTGNGSNAITLGTSGNIIDGFILDGSPTGAARGIKDNSGGTTTGTIISNMTIKNFLTAGVEITPSANTTIDHVTFSSNASDVIVNAANTTISNVSSTGATGIAFDIRNATGTTTLSNLNITTNTTGTGIAFGGASGPQGTITGTNVDVTGGAGGGIKVTGGNAAITFDAASFVGVPDTSSGTAVTITGRSGGSFAFAGSVAANGTASGISVSGATAVNTVSFTGAVGLGTVSTLTGTAVSINNNATASTVSFANIGIVTNSTTGFSAINGGTVNVTTGTVSSTGAQAVNLNGVAAGINFTSTTSTGGFNNVKLTSVTGSVNLGAGALSGVTGVGAVAFLVGDGSGTAGTGGTATISYGGTISAGAGFNTVNIQDHSVGLVTLSGNLTHSGASGSAIVLDDNSSSFTFSGATNNLTTGTSNAIDIIDQTGGTIAFQGVLNIDTTSGIGISLSGTSTGTFNFTGGNLTIDTTGGAGFRATGGGTVSVTGTGNHISSGNGTALNISNTQIGSGNVTFRDITSNGGSANGIILSNTGTAAGNGGLHVTGNGANVGATGGGVIANKTGADGSTTQGSGIYLNNTKDVQLNGLQMNDFQNYGISGTNVTGFTLDHTIINGTVGTSVGGIGEGNVYFTGLSGSASVSNSTFTGAAYDAFHVFNDGAQTLNRLTITGSTFATNAAAGNASNDAIVFQATGGTFNATVQNSTVTSARSDMVQLNLLGTVTSDLVLTGNTMNNTNQNIVSGGGGLTIGGGGPANNVSLTYNISNNTISGSHGAVIAVAKGTGIGASFVGTINSNTIGTQNVAGSGSTQGFGIAVFHDGAGNSNTTITNNQIHGTVGGIYTQVKNGAGGTMTAVIQGNIIDTLDQVNSFTGIYVQTGSNTTNSGTPDNNKSNITLGGAGALANHVDIGANAGFAIAAGITIEQEGNSRVGLIGSPNYAGAPYDFTAIQTYIANLNVVTGSNAPDVFAFGDPNTPAGFGFFGGAQF